MFEYVDRRPFTVPCSIVFAMSWLGDHYALQLLSGFCCEPHGLCRKCLEVSYSISSQGLGSFLRFRDLKLRKHIADFDLIDKDRIYKWKGAVTKVEMTKDRFDHKPHLSLLSLSHTSGTFIFNFQNDYLHEFWETGHYLDKTSTHLIQGRGKQRLVILKRIEPNDYFEE